MYVSSLSYNEQHDSKHIINYISVYLVNKQTTVLFIIHYSYINNKVIIQKLGGNSKETNLKTMQNDLKRYN